MVEYSGDSGYLDQVFRPSHKDLYSSPVPHSYIWFLDVQAGPDWPQTLYIRWRVYNGRKGKGMLDGDRYHY